MAIGNSITLSQYIELFAHDKWSKHFAISTFPDALQEFAEFARNHGVRPTFINAYINVHNLFKYYVNEGVPRHTMVPLEACLLVPNHSCDAPEGMTIADYYRITNHYNFTALDLALMSDDLDLATTLLTTKPEAYKNYFSPVLELFLSDILTGLSEKPAGADFIRRFADLQGNPDRWLAEDNPSTLTDALLKNKETTELALNKTSDPLFSLLKQNATIEDVFSDDKDVVRIAISHGNGFWSTGIWEAARLIMRNHPDVKIHLVDNQMFYSSFARFDAWINPGAGDTYPRDKPFTIKDWNPTEGMEKLYQDALEATLNFNIPYLGFCAGSQHFALYHGGTVGMVEGYNGVKHNIHLTKGSLLYFMTLNKDQQNKALQHCDLPDVAFKGDTAHSFAASSSLLNAEEMRLAATYDNSSVAAGYEHINGIRFGTQFHPEHYYNVFDREPNQHNILENFVLLAKQFHDAKLGKAKFPHDTQPRVLERLVDCIKQEEYYEEVLSNEAVCFVNSTVDHYCFA